MKNYIFISLLFLLTAACPPLYAQTDSLPHIGGIVLDPDTFATTGEPLDVNRSSHPGSKKSLRENANIKPFNQNSELSCGSCAAAAAIMIRRKIYCYPRCKCNFEVEVFSWSYLHNQLVKQYGQNNIRLNNILDLIKTQGIPLHEHFPNTPASHEPMPNDKDRAQASRFQYWTYQPIFKAKKNIPGTANQKEILFRKQLVPKTIAWLDYNIPVIAGLLVTDSFRRLNPKNCLWKAPESFKNAKGHALLVIGYDDVKAEFELLNSFGSSWGCGGMARISYADYTRAVQEGYVIKFDFETGKKVRCTDRY